MLFDPFLKPELLIAQVRKFLFQFGTVPIELQQLFAVFLRLLFRISENGGKARHPAPLLT